VSGVPPAELVASVCTALRNEVAKLGLSIGDEPGPAALVFAEVVDPYSQEVSLSGSWQGQRAGTLTVFPDGRVFAEYQVLLPHPQDAQRYVEAVQVWGRPPALRGEAVFGEFAAS